MLTKTKVIKSIKDLPDQFSIDDLIDRLVVIQKIELGLDQSAKGKVNTTKEAKRKLKI